ncbi:hypothetical protein RND81_02G065600 [Saponaria officinalis]|uniref:Cytochrome P450 n=1 Tax=Saponaria officinalis TaxID=3572 RepID=A0AAW1MRN1_SAPOF
MDLICVSILSILLSVVIPLYLIKHYSAYKTRHEKCPPSPPSRPFVGHLHLIKQPLHRALQDLSDTFGSIYFLKLGFVPTVVISCPSLVEECFTTNDIILANRPRRRSGKHLNFEWTTIGSASYGPFWRDLRRLASVELFSTVRLNMLSGIRDEEMRSLVKGLFVLGKEERVQVEMKSRFSELAFNIIMRMVTGKRYFGAEIEGVEEAKVFRKIASDVFALAGASNPVDFFPFLRWVPFQSMEVKMLAVRKKMDAFLDSLIEDCRRNRNDGAVKVGDRQAMIYNLLDLQASDPLNYSDKIIKGIIMIMSTAGTDTSAVTMEWALSLLLNNPDILHKARAEIDSVVGNNRLVDESDLSDLPVIHNIVNETLRLFPPAPLLVPHEASEDCSIGGYRVNKGTMVIINVWAIHRDPKFWDDPLLFNPERFKDTNSDALRSTWIPFGLGRRSCPGANLANKVVALNLAALIQCFDWEKVGNEDVDLSEGFGLTMPKVTPLEAMCRARKCMINVLSEI